MLPSDVPWSRPNFGLNEPPNAWFTGRAERQTKGLARMTALQQLLASHLEQTLDDDFLPRRDEFLLRAVAEVAMGLTILISGFQFTRIADASIAITDVTGETQFYDLDTGRHR